jgi:hypothetical protein
MTDGDFYSWMQWRQYRSEHRLILLESVYECCIIWVGGIFVIVYMLEGPVLCCHHRSTWLLHCHGPGLILFIQSKKEYHFTMTICLLCWMQGELFSKGLWQWLIHYTNIVLDFVWGIFDIHDISGIGYTRAWLSLYCQFSCNISAGHWNQTRSLSNTRLVH